MKDPINVTTELLNTLWAAQLNWLIATASDAVRQGGTGDDGHDYLIAALDLANYLEEWRFDDDTEHLAALLNTVPPAFEEPYINYYQWHEDFEKIQGFPHLTMFASDGVCPEIYNLNPPAGRDV